MNRLAPLRLPLLLVGGLLALLHIFLCISVAPNRNPVQVILPRWVDHIASVSLVLFVLAQCIAAATRQGWPRVVPLLIAVSVLPIAMGIIAFLGLTTQRAEINRITLPDGRVVMMTLEPVLTDTVLDLWEPHGWC